MKEETLKTIIVLIAFFIILFLFTNKSYYIYISLFLLISCLFKNPVPDFIAKIWLFFSNILGKITNFILLFLVFFLVLTPLSFIRKIFNKEIEGYFFNKNNKSLFKDKTSKFDISYFEKMW